MAGRPTKLTEEHANDLVVLLTAGVPVKVAAPAVGISRRTLDRWLRQDDFRERIRQARATGPVSTEAVTEARLVVLLARAAQFDGGRRRGGSNAAGRSAGARDAVRELQR